MEKRMIKDTEYRALRGNLAVSIDLLSDLLGQLRGAGGFDTPAQIKAREFVDAYKADRYNNGTAYTIQREHDGQRRVMVIRDGEGQERARYALDRGREDAEVRAMRREIERHISVGGTLNNYQW